jgi:hypothetical protein
VTWVKAADFPSTAALIPRMSHALSGLRLCQGEVSADRLGLEV